MNLHWAHADTLAVECQARGQVHFRKSLFEQGNRVGLDMRSKQKR